MKLHQLPTASPPTRSTRHPTMKTVCGPTLAAPLPEKVTTASSSTTQPSAKCKLAPGATRTLHRGWRTQPVPRDIEPSSLASADTKHPVSCVTVAGGGGGRRDRWDFDGLRGVARGVEGDEEEGGGCARTGRGGGCVGVDGDGLLSALRLGGVTFLSLRVVGRAERKEDQSMVSGWRGSPPPREDANGDIFHVSVSSRVVVVTAACTRSTPSKSDIARVASQLSQLSLAMADRPPAVPLHLTSLAILAPSNAPLYVHSFTGKDDEMRAYHLAHAAVDVIEERSESSAASGAVGLVPPTPCNCARCLSPHAASLTLAAQS